tara:strand:+ start:992 stop:1432 length:441 start_codon:yes stop_codon:yes gene_type:complete
MKYKQSVKVKNVTIDNAKIAFNDIDFLKHLITLQPVRVIKWEGTFDGALAHMKFWFFGWRDFIVKHGSNVENDNLFSFMDIGSVLPFGLNKWEHTHKVIQEDSNINIIDNIEFACKVKFVEIFIFPILIAPIIVRKILYKTYNWES